MVISRRPRWEFVGGTKSGFKWSNIITIEPVRRSRRQVYSQQQRWNGFLIGIFLGAVDRQISNSGQLLTQV